RGTFDLAGCLAEGWMAGIAAAMVAGFHASATGHAPAAPPEPEPTPIRPVWAIPQPPGGRRKRFVDQQNDVTVEDVTLAAREGYTSVEHLKRYTTLGMGTDQGRTSN